MSLKEPNKANKEVLKEALENSIMKLRFNIERKEREYASFQLYSNYIFLYKFYQSARKKLFLNTLLDDIYTAVYVHVSAHVFIRTFLWK